MGLRLGARFRLPVQLETFGVGTRAQRESGRYSVGALLTACLLLTCAVSAQVRELYPAPDYTLRHAWHEAIPALPGVLLEGFHLMPSDGAQSFDVYLLDGQIFSAQDAADTFGIAPKDWSSGIRRAVASQVAADPLALATTPKRRGKTTPSSTITLAPPQIPETDTEALPKGPLQIGALLPLPEPIVIANGALSHGAWTALQDGSTLWEVQIESPGALGQRLEITTLDIPPGAHVIVYNADTPDEAYGPFTAIPAGDASLWTPTCFSERIVIECTLPPGTNFQTVRIEVAQATYRYRGFADAHVEKDAGACNLDVSCYEDWAGAALGVGGLGTVTRTGEMLCTFALIADNDPCTDANYVLSAKHCFDSAIPGAGSAEFYWFYQTDACNGTPPASPASVPRTTGGADLIARMGGGALPPFGTEGNDFILLRLRNTPPPGAVKLGWSTEVLALGAEITCIHHPRGDFKRISFGNLSAQNNPRFANFWETTWYAGTTQGASSGSPLLRSDTMEIVGQLWGGLAACANDEQGNTEPDYYGRFDVTYPIVKPWLDPDPLVAGFATSMVQILEGHAMLDVAVVLSGPAPPGGLALDYVIAPGSATPGIDFTVEAGPLHIPSGASRGSISVEILDNFLREGAKSFGIALLEPACGSIDPEAASIHITIIDDDLAHSADLDGDGTISEAELLVLLAFFEAGEFHCDASVPGGFAPGPGNRNCAPHSADYAPADWRISLGEVLRVVQFHNAGGYRNCAEGEDGYCLAPPGP